ncbi:phosphoribosyltransferase family protein [Nocardiopsis sp. L17-MgMaSL7]|uniref:phosphoribosyltransferase family protein n=1 Tax=Nocardiopsis sp. L17-MgMaSL7 TaxID=1938893 RepID=UPI000D8D7C24|nr:phosphoribosyltransferase family protein [Nocardiopsis sp. L17-MgMaSL7]PWV50057.1 phosphoribosyl transferase-like protein [Nocardiopsis sp. L17-MgMaSL7]
MNPTGAPRGRRWLGALLRALRLVAALLDPLTELVQRRDCAGCSGPGDPLCAACRAQLDHRPHRARGRERCPPVWAVGPYAGRHRRILLALKHGGERRLTRFLGERMAVAYRASGWAAPDTLLVPVPARGGASPGRNPVLGLAGACAHEVGPTGTAGVAPVLRYRRRARPQVGLCRADRVSNRVDVFTAEPRKPGGPWRGWRRRVGRRRTERHGVPGPRAERHPTNGPREASPDDVSTAAVRNAVGGPPPVAKGARTGGLTAEPRKPGGLWRAWWRRNRSGEPPERADGPVGGRGDVRGRRVVVVDDVLTTGATVEEATRALRAEGARVVGALVFAERDRVPDRPGSGLGSRSERRFYKPP